MTLTKKFYVYAHIDSVKGETFYIGKGTGKRAYSQERNSIWKNKVKELNGKYEVKILNGELTENEALDLENKYIKEIGKLSEGKGPLINWTDGGAFEGVYIDLTMESVFKDANKDY